MTPPVAPVPAGTTFAGVNPAVVAPEAAPAAVPPVPQPGYEYTEVPPSPGMPAAQPPLQEESNKSYVATWLFAWFLGIFGVDRFYLGKVGTGILKLITFGGLGIWVWVDIILVLAGVTKDKSGRRLAGREKYLKLSLILTIGVFVLFIIADMVFFMTGGYSKLAKYESGAIRSQMIYSNYSNAVDTMIDSLNRASTAQSGSDLQPYCKQLADDATSMKGLKVTNDAVGKAFETIRGDTVTAVTDCNATAASFTTGNIEQFNGDFSRLNTDAQQYNKAIIAANGAD
ncbi:MAG TPA: TM2 domain-containing protein [Candidatus Saccharimonadales bacterium]